MEVNRKGKVLVNQLEVNPSLLLTQAHCHGLGWRWTKVNLCSQSLTKDHELSLKKQQEDVNTLRKHLDHVISFAKWATESHSGTALLYCKRLVSDLAAK